MTTPKLLDARCDQHGIPDDQQKPASIAYVRWKGTRRYSWLCEECLKAQQDKIATIHPVSYGIGKICALYEKYPDEKPESLVVVF